MALQSSFDEAVRARNQAPDMVCITCGASYPRAAKTCSVDGSLLVPEKHGILKDKIAGSIFVDRYEIIEQLGEGGSGVVYKAQQLMVDRFVAIKILKTFHSGNHKMLKRFHQEARAASSFAHPNLVQVHDFGISIDGEAYMVMAFVEGGKGLDSFIHKQGKLSPPRTGRIFEQVCDAMHHAHEKGIVHRDIKPSNILLLDHRNIVDFVKVLDFGIAQLMPEAQSDALRLTQTGHLVGSPHYVSPEQCIQKAVDRRSDIYSIGATLYQCLTGKLPFDGATVPEIVYQHIKEQPKPPSFHETNIPSPWDNLVLKCLQKDPDERFQTMEELKHAIEVCLGKRASAIQSVRVREEKQDETKTILDQIFKRLRASSIAAVSHNATSEHADLLEQLGNNYLQQNKLDEAESLYLGAVSLEEKDRGRNCLEAGTLYTRLGDLYLYRRKDSAAEQFYLRALEIQFALVGQEHLNVAECLENLGTLFYVAANFEQSEKFFGWCLKIRQKLCSPKEELLAVAFDNLAMAQNKLKREDDAAYNERRAQMIREDRLGETSISKQN